MEHTHNISIHFSTEFHLLSKQLKAHELVEQVKEQGIVKVFATVFKHITMSIECNGIILLLVS